MIVRTLLMAAAVAGVGAACGSATATRTQSPSTTAQLPAPQPAAHHTRRPLALTHAETLGGAAFHIAGCADCHTLAAARAHGNVGPDLDRALAGLPRATVVRIVEHKVRVGGGGMMPFGFGMSKPRMEHIAAYVAAAVHAPADGSG